MTFHHQTNNSSVTLRNRFGDVVHHNAATVLALLVGVGVAWQSTMMFGRNAASLQILLAQGETLTRIS